MSMTRAASSFAWVRVSSLDCPTPTSNATLMETWPLLPELVEDYPHELPGEELPLRVRQDRARLDRAGARADSEIVEVEPPGVRVPAASPSVCRSA